MFRRLTIIFVAVIIALLPGIMVFAREEIPVILIADSALLDVEVPMFFPVDVDEEGNVTVADNAKLVNNSHGSVLVSNVEVVSENGWDIVSYDTDMMKEPINTKIFGFVLNGCKTTSDGGLDFNQSQFPRLEGAAGSNSNEIVLDYDAVVPAQTEDIKDTNISRIVFTVTWDD